MGIGLTVTSLNVTMRVAAEGKRNLAFLNMDDRFTDTLDDGQGVDKCDLFYHAPEDSATGSLTIAAGGNYDFALDDGSLYTFSGNQAIFARVKIIKLENTGAANIRMVGLGITIPVNAYGCAMVYTPDATAYSATGLKIRINNDSGTTEASFQLTLVGEASGGTVSSSSSSASSSSTASTSSTNSSSSVSASSVSASSVSASSASSALASASSASASSALASASSASASSVSSSSS